MRKIWDFMREPMNLALILAIASGAGWLWHEFRPQPTSANGATAKEAIAAGAVNQTASARGDNSHAINAATNATVTISGGGQAR